MDSLAAAALKYNLRAALLISLKEKGAGMPSGLFHLMLSDMINDIIELVDLRWSDSNILRLRDDYECNFGNVFFNREMERYRNSLNEAEVAALDEFLGPLAGTTSPFTV